MSCIVYIRCDVNAVKEGKVPCDLTISVSGIGIWTEFRITHIEQRARLADDQIICEDGLLGPVLILPRAQSICPQWML